jgi:hypothetical protein
VGYSSSTNRSRLLFKSLGMRKPAPRLFILDNGTTNAGNADGAARRALSTLCVRELAIGLTHLSVFSGGA